MAFASGPISFRRYFISGPAPADVTDAFVEALNGHAFGRNGAGTDESEVGWTGPRHLFDTEIAAEHIAFGRFVQLAMRVDRKAVPPGILKSYVRMEEDAALKAAGREYLSKQEKEQAREAARQRAEREMKNGMFRRIAAYPLLMDLDRQTVYFAGLGATLNDQMSALFLDTFGCALELVEAGRLAYRIMEAAKDPRSVEDARPFHLVREPEGREGDDGALAGERSFLGKEFLTWLWWRIDGDDSALRLSTGDEVAVMIDRVVRLECDFGLTGTTAITADGPAKLPEAKAALGIGKQPTRMGLVFGGRAGEFSTTLDGPKMAVTSLTLPEEEEDKRDLRARIERRFELIADATTLMDVLFELFLRRRTAKDWPRELGNMRAWATDVHRRTSTLVASA